MTTEENDVFEVKSGNLLADDADALVNTVNTVGVMGKGIALQFKRAYPEMFDVYRKAAKHGDIEIGRMQVWPTNALTGPRFIINFPTKRHWKAPSRIDDVRAGLDDLVRVIRELDIRSIAIPPLGCGNGGLNWADVAPLINQALAPLETSLDVRIYPPAGAPPAEEMIDRRPKPALTATRSALLELVNLYHEVTLEWPTPLVVQKLAYFLQIVGRPMRLDFVKGRYGPYADNLTKSLRDMEGHYLIGFGDGTARVHDAEPLRIHDKARADMAEILAADGSASADVNTVADLIAGFESPYGLELLATVHWTATREGAHDPAEARQAIEAWTSRKKRMFTQHHVDAAWAALDQAGRLPAAATV